MKVFFALFVTVFWATRPVLVQQNIKDYIQKNVVRVNAIEPDSINFTDLLPIGKAIGDATVVMLGEEDHGDAPTFLAKTRLVKYLHEQKGFHVLAFESDIFGLNYGWETVSKTHPVIDTFILKNVFAVWTVCNTCSNLFYKYLPATYSTATPLTLPVLIALGRKDGMVN